jgi:2-dehydro-3-deoxygluconokinase
VAVHPGGAESNVCAALAGLGRRCGWISRLPDNPLGRLVLRRLQAAGVDSSAVVLAPNERLGTYYAEFATPPRPIQVIYDRADSAAARMTPADVNWEYLLRTRILHLTGITPALSQKCRQLVAEAIGRAQAAGVTVSFDVNYRHRLWSRTEAAAALRPLIAQVNCLICAEADARYLFDCAGDEQEVLACLRSLTQAHTLVLTRSEAGAVALEGEQLLQQPAWPAHVVDRFGAGDAFTAGVLDGLLDNSLAEGLARGAILGALALSQAGDMLMTTRAELEAIRANAGRGVLR